MNARNGTEWHKIDRITLLKIIFIIATAILLTRLFYLQVIKRNDYLAIAKKTQQSQTELPARRGEILVRDHHGNELFRLATNITLDLLFVDPTLVEHKQYVAEKLAPLLFNLEQERGKETERIRDLRAKTDDLKERQKLAPRTDDELFQGFKENLLNQISQERRNYILLEENLDAAVVDAINQKHLAGVYASEQKLYVHAFELENPRRSADLLGPLIDIESDRLLQLFTSKNRYIVLQRKLPPETSEKIRALIQEEPEKFAGVRLREEFYRFYPERELAAQTLGFVTHANTGVYGVEGRFDADLQGKTGILATQRDAGGQPITVGDSIIRPAVDGDTLVLTIDRSIQREVEKLTAAAVKEYRADAGLVIIMEPKTGRVVALVHAPNFDPNNFGSVYEKEEIKLTPQEVENLITVEERGEEHTYLVINKDTNQRLQVFVEPSEEPEAPPRYFVYKNRVGAAVYRNRAVQDAYEPGSIFKVITMAAGLDSNEITPRTIVNERGPIQVDEFEIHNATDIYPGAQTMTQVLERSSNIGIAFVAQKLGRGLFYSYMKLFGFGERTDIEFDNELSGSIQYYNQWADSELVTHGFGQGLTVTPIQMVNAIAAIANGGLLMQPTIIDSTIADNKNVIEQEPRIIRRVITKGTADTITAMMVSAVENGVARRGQVPGHYIAGKTGTAQTYKRGKPITGPGTTIGSFIGFAPVENPQFAVLVKIDHPRSSEWADATAAPLFQKIGTFLFEYYGIPPDKK